MSKYFIIVLSVFAIHSSFGQSNVSVEKNQFKIDIFLWGLDFVYEHGFTDKNTLYSEVGSVLGYHNKDYTGTAWSFYPYINEQLRHYYNLEKRASKGRRTAYNSGNFVALYAIYHFKPISTTKNFFERMLFDSSNISSFTIGPVWGLQRTYGNFNMGLNMGVGDRILKFQNEYENKLVPIFNFSLGWTIR